MARTGSVLLSVLLSLGGALSSRALQIAAVVGDFTDGDPSDDAAAGVALHKIVADIVDDVLAGFPETPRDDVRKLTSGLQLVLEGLLGIIGQDVGAKRAKGRNRRAKRAARRAARAPTPVDASATVPAVKPVGKGKGKGKGKA